MAYKVPQSDILMSNLKPKVSSSGGSFNLTQLTDGDLAVTNLLPSNTEKGMAWIQFEFEKPQIIKALTVVGGGDKGPFGMFGELKDTRALEVSDDGNNFKWICFIPAGGLLQQTITIPVTTAKFFRITFQYMVTDSWEAGVQNWTDNLAEEFSQRRGYSLLNWMPVLAGHIIKSSEASEHFLWDFRKTLSELVAQNHYDQLTTILARHGMKRYSESHESGRALIADGMEVKRTAAVPMSAMWTSGMIGGDGTGYKSDIRESASVAHIYGQNLVAAESLTSIGNAWS